MAFVCGVFCRLLCGLSVFVFMQLLTSDVMASGKDGALVLWKKPVVYLLSDYHDDPGQVPIRVDFIKDKARTRDIVLIEGLIFGDSDRKKIEADPHSVLLRRYLKDSVRIDGWERVGLLKHSKHCFFIFSQLMMSWLQNRYQGNPDLIPKRASQGGMVQTLTAEVSAELYQFYETYFVEGVIGLRNAGLVSLVEKLSRLEPLDRQYFVILGKDHINSELVKALGSGFQVVIPDIKATIPHTQIRYTSGQSCAL